MDPVPVQLTLMTMTSLLECSSRACVSGTPHAAGSHSAAAARPQQQPPSQRQTGHDTYPSPSVPGPIPFPAPAATPGTAATAQAPGAAQAGSSAVVLVADEWPRHPNNDVLQPNAAPISVDQTEACCWSPYR